MSKLSNSNDQNQGVVTPAFIDLKPHLAKEDGQYLIELSVFPSPEAIQRTANEYIVNEEFEIWGLLQDGKLVGFVGIHFTEDTKEILEIRHIAVNPEERGKGLGEKMVQELIKSKDPHEIKAETDDDAVDFYKKLGFEIENLGEKYPGIVRYKYTLRLGA